MAVRPYRRTKRQALPRRDLQGRRSTVVLDARNNPIDNSLVSFDVENCTIQPSSGDELKTLEEGFRDAEAFTIFTSSVLRTAQRGTSQKADEIYLDAPFTAIAGWFTVVKSKPWANNVIAHFQVIAVRKNPN